MKGLNGLMRTKELMTGNYMELMEGNYMEALLRAAILLGDLHRTVPVREITISGFLIRNHIRKLYPRCKIVAQNEQPSYLVSTVIPPMPAVDYLILYPIRNHTHSIPS